MPVRLSWVISSGLCADLARWELGCPQGGSGLPGVVACRVFGQRASPGHHAGRAHGHAAEVHRSLGDVVLVVFHLTYCKGSATGVQIGLEAGW